MQQLQSERGELNLSTAASSSEDVEFKPVVGLFSRLSEFIAL
jgi:hypothetical protein